METTIAVKARSGHIYRMKVAKGWQDLPQSPAIYCFMFPQNYPGAPIRPLYWGEAGFDLRIETRDNDLRREAIRQGANLIGVILIDGMIARRRALNDLLSSFPVPKSDDNDPSGPKLNRRRTRTNIATTHRRYS